MRFGRVITIVVAAGFPLPTMAQGVPGVPGVDIRLSTPPSALAQGAPVTATVVADPRAHVVVFRVTTDNRIVVISPRTPDQGGQVQGNGRGRSGERGVRFRTDPADGVGHLFAVASYTPFDFSQVSDGGNWDVQELDSPQGRNPQAMANWFLKLIVPSAQMPYSVNAVAYYVGVTPPTSDSDSTAQTADAGQDVGPPQYPGDSAAADSGDEGMGVGVGVGVGVDTMGSSADAPYPPAPSMQPPPPPMEPPPPPPPYAGGYYPTYYYYYAPYVWYGPRRVARRYYYGSYCAYTPCVVVPRVVRRYPPPIVRRRPPPRVPPPPRQSRP